MDKEKLIAILAGCREIQFRCWENYRNKEFLSDLRDLYDLRVRALDYVMEGLKRDTL